MQGQLIVPELDLETYCIRELDSVLTPALLVYPEIVEANIATTLQLLGGDPNRWRPHVKTAKLGLIMEQLVQHGVTNFKCATTLELLVACNAGASDVLVAYPMQGANTLRVRDIARQFPSVQVSALVDSPTSIASWVGGEVTIFVDVNPGMDRTGIEQGRIEEIVQLAHSIQRANLVFRGLHYYDGHLGHLHLPLPERTALAHRGYDRLMQIVAALGRASISITEVITAGTPSFPCTCSYKAFRSVDFMHRASPGTVVYIDLNSLSQLSSDHGYRPAVLVLSRVVSHPTATRITCDAGHKALSIDCGVPNCAVLGRPDLQPGSPTEEHLPLDLSNDTPPPRIGEFLYLVPRHVCPTVNNFDDALIVSDGGIAGAERVTARGREGPLRAVPMV